jgi:hypothetical protein
MYSGIIKPDGRIQDQFPSKKAEENSNKEDYACRISTNAY